MNPENDIVYRLRKRAEIRRQIPSRKSVQEGAPDRIADLLEEAADVIDEMRKPKCDPHPKAPHGFDRNASHNMDRYVCECESWNAYDAGYHDGFQKGIDS